MTDSQPVPERRSHTLWIFTAFTKFQKRPNTQRNLNFRTSVYLNLQEQENLRSSCLTANTYS